MPFEMTDDVCVCRDDQGRVRQLEHVNAPYRGEVSAELAAAAAPLQPRELASQYLRSVMGLYEMAEAMSDGAAELAAAAPIPAPEQLRFASQKSVVGQAVVSYVQTCCGIPVWNSGFAVRMDESPMQVIGSQSTLLDNLQVAAPPTNAPYLPERLDVAQLAHQLGLSSAAGGSAPTITGKHLFIYRYRAADRTLEGESESPEPDQGFASASPTLPLLPVCNSVSEGGDYFVTEVQFTWGEAGRVPHHWTALIEVNSGSVLYLRPHLGCLSDGLAFHSDPVTQSGSLSNNADAADSVLDSFRSRVRLEELSPAPAGSPQELRGRFVRLVDVSRPNLQPPRETPPSRFDYQSTSNHFSAVNAYYHCDRLFRLVESLGFNVSSYFNGTTFPVQVDHRAAIGTPDGNEINASAPGTADRRGSDGFRFALARANSTLGLANDWRVVLHEFGHALLWDNVHLPNFGFAHSAGDSLAAILNDPENRAERGLTFPWVAHIIDRRHDRTAAGGWAWYGPRYGPFTAVDRAGYLAEQILSSTLFRVYRAAGGDSTDLATRQFAAHYVAYLIIKAIALLTPVSNARTPEEFASTLIQADTGDFVVDGKSHPAGVLSKVIRWAFEVQGAFLSPAAPRPNFARGLPPAVDVFIDDGRNGEYSYRVGPAQTNQIWVRRAADAGATHQPPLRNAVNSVYVLVKNRGTRTAVNVTVDVRRARAGVDAWPVGWTSLTAQPLPVPDVAPGASVLAGPFPWRPDSASTTLVASVAANGDPSNASRFSAARPIPLLRLLHVDNNIAFRTVGAV